MILEKGILRRLLFTDIIFIDSVDKGFKNFSKKLNDIENNLLFYFLKIIYMHQHCFSRRFELRQLHNRLLFVNIDKKMSEANGCCHDENSIIMYSIFKRIYVENNRLINKQMTNFEKKRFPRLLFELRIFCQTSFCLFWFDVASIDEWQFQNWIWIGNWKKKKYGKLETDTSSLYKKTYRESLMHHTLSLF